MKISETAWAMGRVPSPRDSSRAMSVALTAALLATPCVAQPPDAGSAIPAAATRDAERMRPSVAQPRASSDALMSALRKAHPGTRFSEAVRTEVPDLYEVWMNDTVAYVSSRNPRFFVFGRLFDTRTMRDVTAPRLALRTAVAQTRNTASDGGAHEKLAGSAVRPSGGATDNAGGKDGNQRNTGRAAGGGAGNGENGIDGAEEARSPVVPIPQLPLADALRTVQGHGDRQLVVFSDPGCGYCQQLERELAGIGNVTIHTFIVPFQGTARPLSIWCAADRARAWRRWMLQGDTMALRDTANCAHPIERNLALARRWQVSATPTLIWSDGQRTVGYLDRAAIDARLSAASTSFPPAMSGARGAGSSKEAP